MKTTELNEKIAKLEKAIASPATPENFKASMKDTIKKLQGQLAEAEEKEKKEEEEKTAEKEKKQAEKGKKAEATKEKKDKKSQKRKEKETARKAEKASRKVVFEGKEISRDDADYCEKLLKAWNKRREKAKASAKKSKTKPVFEKITEGVESEVFRAIKNVPVKKISENPDKYIKLFKDIEDHTEKFLTGFKQLLGEDYDRDDIKESLKPIKEFIEKLKEKFKE